MICNNKFLIDICDIMLSFLKSENDEIEISNKIVKRITYKTGSSGCVINFKILEMKMIYKPNNDFVTNDDGATVIIKMPFHDIKENKSLDFVCYFMRKGQQSYLIYNQDVVKQSNRVVYDISDVNNNLDILPNEDQVISL